jgi:hypothetical protein
MSGDFPQAPNIPPRAELQLERFIDHPAGELLDALALAEADLVLLDEPPGHLSSFSFARGEKEHRRWFRVSLRPAPGLVSYRCTWSMATIRAACISTIRIGRDLLCLRPEWTFAARPRNE